MMTAGQRIAPKHHERQRSVHRCNFRSAGRLSNENAGALTSIHEALGRQLSTTLDALLDTALEVKLGAVDQVQMAEHIAELSPLTYVVPFNLSAASSSVIVECDIHLVFPLVDLLLGGMGSPISEVRDLSEIEEKIMFDLIALIVRQAEFAWHMPADSLTPAKRIKTPMLYQFSPPNDKVTCVRFDLDISGAQGALRFVFPTLFLNALTQQIKLDQPQKRGTVRYFPGAPLRERILDCDIDLAVELTGLKISVRDAVALRPGSIIKLRAPVKTPGVLTAGGLGLFEVTPVRNGAQKAAQLGRRISPAEPERN
jgi:flagellar motor switch protein FliM